MFLKQMFFCFKNALFFRYMLLASNYTKNKFLRGRNNQSSLKQL